MKSIEPLLKEAEKHLKATPFDDAHDLSHHKRVWGKAQEILKGLKNKNVDKSALQVAVMWHDVMIVDKKSPDEKQKNIDKILKSLENLMDKNGFEKDFQKTVIDAIKYHEFNVKKQANTEGEILFDADKLDALDSQRYKKVIKSFREKKFSRIQVLLYSRVAKLWLKTMRNRFHFDVSRKIHDSMTAKLANDKDAIELGNHLGIDIIKLLK